MKQQLEAIRAKALEAIGGAEKAEDLEALRVQYLGKRGELTAVLKQMGSLSAEERPVIGQLANEVRAKLEESVETRAKELAAKALEMKLKAEAVDVTIPGKAVKIGKKHPMYQVLDEIKDIFVGMGFEILEDREVETADYNFTKLNCLEGHPPASGRTRSTSPRTAPFCCAHRPLPCRSTRWRRALCPSVFSLRAACTARTRWTPPIPPCSTRSRAWSSTRA